MYARMSKDPCIRLFDYRTQNRYTRSILQTDTRKDIDLVTVHDRLDNE